MSSVGPDFLFEEVWNLWPCKKDKVSSKKAFSWAFNQKWFKIEEIKECVKIYTLRESEFTKERQIFGNWLRENRYQDILKEVRENGAANIKENEDELEKEALYIIEFWNKNKRKWWSRVDDIEGRKEVVKKALRNKYFKDNWKKGMKWLFFLFKSRRYDTEYMSKIIPSIPWFCYHGEDYSTISRILEGEFGNHYDRADKYGEKMEPEEGDYILNQHDLDLLNVVSVGMENRSFIQNVVMLDSGNEEVAVDWYVKRMERGWELKYRGHKVKEENVNRNDLEGSYSIFLSLKKMADEYNYSRYRPDIKEQKRREDENEMNKVKKEGGKKECPL